MTLFIVKINHYQDQKTANGRKETILKLRKEEKFILVIAQALGIANAPIWHVLKKKESTDVLTTRHQAGKEKTADNGECTVRA